MKAIKKNWQTLSKDPYWKNLCLLAQAKKDKAGQIPSDWWVKTQAPLYADGASILEKWPKLQENPHHRFALAPLVAKMVSVGIVDNQVATDRLTKVSRPTQLAIIKKTIPLIDTELADRTDFNDFIRREVGELIST